MLGTCVHTAALREKRGIQNGTLPIGALRTETLETGHSKRDIENSFFFCLVGGSRKLYGWPSRSHRYGAMPQLCDVRYRHRARYDQAHKAEGKGKNMWSHRPLSSYALATRFPVLTYVLGVPAV